MTGSPARMPARRRRGRRSYQRSGFYTRPPEPTPEVAQAMAELRAQLVADEGGPDVITTAESILIDLAVAAAVKHANVARYLATMPSLVDKRHRRVWRVVHDSTQLAAHLQSLLKDLGLERKAHPVPSLAAYLEAKRDV
jgi:hypothetical protein